MCCIFLCFSPHCFDFFPYSLFPSSLTAIGCFLRPSGKPSRPKGPLKVENVYEKGALLKWEKPEDDGGIPIKEYVVEKMDTGTGKYRTQCDAINASMKIGI